MNNEIYIADADLQKAFKDIDKYTTEAQDGIRKEILATAKRVVNRAQRNLADNRSVQSGLLRASLRVENDLSKYEAKAGTDVEYASYVEFGTPPHIIQVKTKKVLARYTGTTGGKEGFQIFGKRVHHPGSKAKPFLFPAAESERMGYIERLKKILSGSK